MKTLGTLILLAFLAHFAAADTTVSTGPLTARQAYQAITNTILNRQIGFHNCRIAGHDENGKVFFKLRQIDTKKRLAVTDIDLEIAAVVNYTKTKTTCDNNWRSFFGTCENTDSEVFAYILNDRRVIFEIDKGVLTSVTIDGGIFDPDSSGNTDCVSSSPAQ
jgi:hypothetical protein